LLGPTNTGKTHRAVERMLEHASGMIGLPLRLLAREVFDRITSRIGEAHVALVTGEEKRVPKHPRYWVCTVEAMPVDREVDFLAVDEIQLAAHRQRGHVFTDRLLRARGTHETWFMGSDTMEPLVRELLPAALIQRHPRFSSLTGLGSLGLSALPARTAVVGFSAPQVYELAERLRRKRGGAAVVLGALSPRTRNAQVALYQSGEVQYMVATDAIGMGLNMDIDLVAFAGLQKFDGRESRLLEAAELAQIAGRAGRHLNDGSFATLSPLAAMSDPLKRAIESHRFPALRVLMWRNSDLDTSSIDALILSLRQRPQRACLRPVEQAEDFAALLHLAERPSVRAAASSPQQVRLLWDVCQIPDFRQLMPEVHASLLEEIFTQLASSTECLDPEWLERRVCRLDDPEGDIDTLMNRIAFIRTWTYVANHGTWVADGRRWQERTRKIEDRLSDALHARLVERFVSKRADGRGMQRSRPVAHGSCADNQQAPSPAFHSPFQVLSTMRLAPTRTQVGPRTVDLWVQELVEAPHERFHAGADGKIWDGEERIARMTRGVDLLHPEVMLQLEDDPGAGARARISRRLVAWTRDLVDRLLSRLRGPEASELSAAARGVVYQIEQGLGTVSTASAADQLRLLTPRDYKLLRAMDARFGRRLGFVRSLLEPQRVQQRAALCSAYFGVEVQPPRAGVLAFRAEPGTDQLCLLIGYLVMGGQAIRADLIERMEGVLAEAASQGPFRAPQRVASWLGCSETELDRVIAAFGYRKADDDHFTKQQCARGFKNSPPEARSRR
jgi:ATP-dependent RNA helicase SUPV3L1/SUV3